MKENFIKINRKDLTAAMLSKKLFPHKNIEIETEEVECIIFRDIFEVYLHLSRSKNWRWIDSNGNFKNKQGFFRSGINILSDFICWPFIFHKYKGLVGKIEKKSFEKNNTKQFTKALFLRTDHWFNIKSGGSVGHLKGVIDGLRSLGVKTHIVSSDNLSGVDINNDFTLCKPDYSKGKNLPNITELLYNSDLLNKIESGWNEWAPDFIYQRYSLGNFAGIILKQKYKIPYVCEYNGSLTWISKKWYGHKIFHENLINKIELLNLQAADLVVVVSDAMEDELLKRGIEKNKILVNPNGVDPEIYTPEIDGAEIRKKYNLENKIVLGFIGTFGRWHGAEVLAEAFGRLLNENPEYRNTFRLLMVGDGVTMNEVKSSIEKYKIENEVVLTGLIPQSEGPIHLAACDVLISPHIPTPDGTPFFGSPTKLFEYMAMGKCIVASELDQIGKILKNDYSAILVKPADIDDLKKGIVIASENPELRNRLGRNARSTVVENYTWQKNVEKVIKRLKVE